MIKFKTLKYKNYKQAKALYSRMDQDNDAVLDEVVGFAASLVAEWDFTDEDTGAAIAPGPDVIDELSLGQFRELFREFNQKMGFAVRLADNREPAADETAEDVSEVTVPKTNAEPSLSG